MQLPLDQDEPILEFRASSMRVLGIIAKGFFIAVLLGAALATIMIFLLAPLAWPQGTPTWAMVAAGAVLVLFWVWLVRLLNRCEPSRILISSHAIWFGGRFFGAAIGIDDIGLIELNHPTREWTGRLLVLTTRAGRKWSINLPAHEAQICFFNIYELCDHAPAIDDEYSFYPPRNPAHYEQARQVLGAAFRRKARLARHSAIYCLIGTPLMALLLAIAGPGSVMVWIAMFIMPIGAIVSWREARIYRVQSEAAVAEWDLDEAI